MKNKITIFKKTEVAPVKKNAIIKLTQKKIMDNKNSQNEMKEEKIIRGRIGVYVNDELLTREMTDEEEDGYRKESELMDYQYGMPKKAVEFLRKTGRIKS